MSAFEGMFNKDVEVEEVTEDNMILAAIGILPSYFMGKGYKKVFPNKRIIHNKKITNTAFEWYLNVCNDEEMKSIEIDKLNEKQQKLLKARLTKGAVEIKEDGVIQQYINKNRELTKDNNYLLDKYNENLVKKNEYEHFTKFLYDLLSKRDNFFEGIEVTDYILNELKEIKSVVG